MKLKYFTWFMLMMAQFQCLYLKTVKLNSLCFGLDDTLSSFLFRAKRFIFCIFQGIFRFNWKSIENFCEFYNNFFSCLSFPWNSFTSQKTGRGPLVGPDWKNNVKPVMTCYKLVTCEFKWFGLQSRVESFIHKTERRLFTVFHRWVRKSELFTLIMINNFISN